MHDLRDINVAVVHGRESGKNKRVDSVISGYSVRGAASLFAARGLRRSSQPSAPLRGV